jgi:hypothetical protein
MPRTPNFGRFFGTLSNFAKTSAAGSRDHAEVLYRLFHTDGLPVTVQHENRAFGELAVHDKK